MVEVLTVPVVVTRSHFGYDSTDELMLNSITNVVIVTQSNRDTKIQQNSINTSMGLISIVIIVKGKTITDSVERIVK